MIKDETITSRDYAIDGGAGYEIAFAIVKSGTTSEQFDCVPSNTAPTALLKSRRTGQRVLRECLDFHSGGFICEQSSPRTVRTSSLRVPDNGGSDSGIFHWGCGSFTDHSQCSMIISFRGIGSSDPDGDIVNWSLDFGDGTSVSGSWSTAPPTEIAHDYTNTANCSIGRCFVTLTVTDSAGQSASAVIRMYSSIRRPTDQGNSLYRRPRLTSGRADSPPRTSSAPARADVEPNRRGCEAPESAGRQGPRRSSP